MAPDLSEVRRLVVQIRAVSLRLRAERDAALAEVAALKRMDPECRAVRVGRSGLQITRQI